MDEHIGVSPENVRWGDVGNAGYALEKLTELTDWMFKRGEYAE